MPATLLRFRICRKPRGRRRASRRRRLNHLGTENSNPRLQASKRIPPASTLVARKDRRHAKPIAIRVRGGLNRMGQRGRFGAGTGRLCHGCATVAAWLVSAGQEPNSVWGHLRSRPTARVIPAAWSPPRGHTGVAQSGKRTDWGPGGRRFKSCSIEERPATAGFSRPRVPSVGTNRCRTSRLARVVAALRRGL